MNIEVKKRGQQNTNNEAFSKINELNENEYIIIKNTQWKMKTPLTSYLLRRRLSREFKVERLLDDTGWKVTGK